RHLGGITGVNRAPRGVAFRHGQSARSGGDSVILLTRKRKRWHGVMHPNQQDNIHGIRATEVVHPLPVVPIFGLKTYICPACGLWFALTAEAPGGSHLHYFCPACGCPTMDEGCF